MAQRAIFVHGFIDDVPTVNSSFIAPDHGADVRAHARNERIPRYTGTGSILEDPCRRLIVPDERVPDDHRLVSLAKGDVAVGRPEVELSWLRLDNSPLQHIFGRDTVELARDDRIGNVRLEKAQLAIGFGGCLLHCRDRGNQRREIAELDTADRKILHRAKRLHSIERRSRNFALSQEVSLASKRFSHW